jgi:hypothetical protein
MTLGTNASLIEQIKYAPDEIDQDFLLESIKQLEEWDELGSEIGIDTPQDVRDLDDKLTEWQALSDIDIFEPKDVKQLKADYEDLEDEIARLNEIIEGLEDDNANLRITNVEV